VTAVEAMQYLLRAAAPYGVRGTITSGSRSRQEQADLYAAYVARGRTGLPAAAPGRSKHETGQAVDVSASPEVLAWLGAVWESWGGTWGGRWRKADPVHFEV